MKTNLLACCLATCGLLVLGAGCLESPTAPDDSSGTDIPEPEGWDLVWHDEFDSGSIDKSRWGFEVNGDGGGNNELQYYTDRPVNAHVEDDDLIITARKETYTGQDGTRRYTSARLRTKNKGDWKYGRFEVRAQLPEGQGLWPAIWMLPTDWAYGGWPKSGEIDIMELLGHEPDKIHGTIHYGRDWPNNSHTGESTTLDEGTFSEGFHVFALEWERGEIRWYVDGKHYLTQTEWFTPSADYPAPFDKRFHMLLNVAVGGDWPGSPDETTTFPQRMKVDYVRVYEKEESDS